MSRPSVREAAFAALLTALPLAVLHGPALLRGRAITPADLAFFYMHPWLKQRPPELRRSSNDLLADAVVQGHPWAAHTARRLAQGSIPLWNPHVYAGAPFLATLQTGVLFPANLLLLALGPVRGPGIVGLLCVWFAGWTLYLFLRARGLGFGAAALAGGALPLTGFFTAWFLHPHVRVACWLPLLLLGSDRLARKRDLASTAWLALVIGVQFLGGHIETSLHVLFATGVFLVVRLWGETRAAGPFLEGLARAALAGAWGLAVAAVQLLPFFEALFQSRVWAERGAVTVNPHYLPVSALLGLVIPDAFGNPCRAGFNGPSNWSEQAGYVGVLPVLFAALGVVAAVRGRPARVFVALALFALGVAYRAPGLYEAVTRLPGFRVSANARLLLVLDVSLLVLAAEGLEWWLRRGGRGGRRLAVAALALGVVPAFLAADDFLARRDRMVVADLLAASDAKQFVLALGLYGAFLAGGAALVWRGGSLRPGRALGLAALLTIGDLLLFARGYVPSAAVEHVLPETASIRWLRERLVETGAGAPDRLLPIANTLNPDIPTFFGLADVRGYDPMVPRVYTEYIQRAGQFDPVNLIGNTWRSPLLDLLGVRYVVTPEPLDLELGMGIVMNPGETRMLPFLGDRPVRGFTLLTSLSDALETPDGAVVGEVLAECEGGPLRRFPIRAGIETAEWAHRQFGGAVRHRQPAVAHAWEVEGGDGGRYARENYAARFELGEPVRLRRIAVRAIWPGAKLRLHRLWLGEEGPGAGGAGGALDGLELVHSGDLFVYRNARALPRAFLVPRWRVIPDAKARLEALTDPAFDPRQEALLEEEPMFPPDAGELPAQEARAEIALYRPEEVRVNVSLPRRALLVLTDTWFPGWQAEPGPAAAPVRPLRADHAFRAVPLGAGVQTVRFTYDPLTFGIGLYASLVVGAFTVALLVTLARPRPAGAAAPPGPTPA